MLKSLTIHNYSLIENLELTPSSNFNIITGETGAGKSIMLGAVGLLLGNRADTKVLLDQNDKCIIEGTFDIRPYALNTIFEEYDLDYSDLCIIRREISSTGKSRAFVNDTPATLEVLKKLGDYLMDVHSQHDTMLLGSMSYQLTILDSFAGNIENVKKYQQQFKAYKTIQATLQKKKEELSEMQRQSDYNQFIYTELSEAELISGEMELKEAELKRMENAEDIKQRLEYTSVQLSGAEQSILSVLQSAIKQLQPIQHLSEAYGSISGRMQSVHIELKDILSEIETESEHVEFDPLKIAPIQERLDKIFTLLKKHRVQTVEELLQIQESLEGKVSSLDSLAEEVASLEGQLKKAFEGVIAQASVLSAARAKAIPVLEKEVQYLLKELSMPDAFLTVQLQKEEPGILGADKISMLFTANKGVAPGELKQVASGGEFSRLMLSIKYVLAKKISLPTIIFDEIDTGISGEVSIKMGKMIREMSARHQVVVITHLPQIAAMGDKHYFVYKDSSGNRSVSRMKELKKEDRILEIAKMIGGEAPSNTALKNAKEMLETSK